VPSAWTPLVTFLCTVYYTICARGAKEYVRTLRNRRKLAATFVFHSFLLGSRPVLRGSSISLHGTTPINCQQHSNTRTALGQATKEPPVIPTSSGPTLFPPGAPAEGEACAVEEGLFDFSQKPRHRPELLIWLWVRGWIRHNGKRRFRILQGKESWSGH
jgi:hypothetical protein